MTKEQLLRQYDSLMLCVENGKYGETKETVRKLMEGALDELVEDVRADERKRIVEWYNSRIESDGELTSAPSGKEIITHLTQ